MDSISTFVTSSPRSQREVLAAALLEKRRRCWREQPSAFVREVLQTQPTCYQSEVLDAVLKYRRVAVRSPHGAGKTSLAAWLVLWAVANFERDFKVITTASAWRQLVRFTWPEIHKWYRTARWELVGFKPELLTLSLKTQGGEAFAVASDKPDLIEGAHASTLLYIFDEAKGIPLTIWDAVEGAFSTGNCYALAISTPGSRSGRFYEIHRRAPGFEDWHTRHIKLEEALAARRVSQEWVEARKRQWGEDSPVFQARVLGEFPEQNEDALFSLAWIETARERELQAEGETVAGLDVARFGSDDSALVVRQGACVLSIETWQGQDLMMTTGRVKAAGVHANIDIIGIGSGVFDRLREQHHPCTSINVSTAANDSEHFANLRAEMYWKLRERFQQGEIDLTRISRSHYDRLSGELTAMQFRYTSGGKIILELKDEMKKRLGYSPDLADALALAFLVKKKVEVCGFSINASPHAFIRRSIL
ncbi:hypothetical protein HUU05_21085, partial [candidate division KSB1 bacterium]|nr:hypothetical protein [candidate division KSB1 bacterium]